MLLEVLSVILGMVLPSFELVSRLILTAYLSAYFPFYPRSLCHPSPSQDLKHAAVASPKHSAFSTSLCTPLPVIVFVQAAHGAEVLSLAFSPIMVPAPVPVTTAVAVTPSVSSSSTSSNAPGTATTASSSTPLSGIGEGADVKELGSESEAVDERLWEAINPLAPGARQRLREAQSKDGEDSQVLVLLASASRDRLVHIFDASTSLSTHKSQGCCSSTAGGDGDGVGFGLATEMELGEQGDACKRTRLGEAICKYSLLKTLENHSGAVTAVKFAKDGSRCEQRC